MDGTSYDRTSSYVASTGDPKYVDSATFNAYKTVWDDLVTEVNLIGTRFSMNVILYDETEDYYDTELKYPYKKRRNQLSTLSLDMSQTNFPVSTQYFKKSEACEEKPDLSTYKTLIEDKEKKGYTSPKQCTYTKIKHSHMVATKDGT